jgi:outer membrane protein TolC
MQIREAYAAYRAAHAIAVRERDEVLPLRQSIAAQDLERYNAAQISVFDLLADARAAIAANAEHIESVRDFWIARSALDAALLGPPPAAPRVPQQNSQRGDTP